MSVICAPVTVISIAKWAPENIMVNFKGDVQSTSTCSDFLKIVG